MITKVTPTELREQLNRGVVTFQFIKKDGTLRTAKGTTNPSLIKKTPKGGYNPAKEAGYSIYFDVEANNFRCYNENNLVGVVSL